MNKFDVRVYAIRRRPARRRPFEVRWQAAGRARSKSFITRALADSYRAELIRAARQGLEFDPATGEPVLWAGPEPVTVTWYQHAAAYAAMKWPGLAAHSRASLADALATVTPALTRTAPKQPQAAALRTALYQHAFNPARPATDAATARILDWVQQASLPLARLADPVVLRQALDALTLRLDGGRAAANTVIRKRAVFHGAPGYAVETGLLESNPADRTSWRVPNLPRHRTRRAADPVRVGPFAGDQAVTRRRCHRRTVPGVLLAFTDPARLSEQKDRLSGNPKLAQMPGRAAQARPPGRRIHDPPHPQGAEDPSGAEAAHRHDSQGAPVHCC